MGAKIDISPGQKFNMLTVIKEVEKFVQPSGQYQRGFLCLCDCGEKAKVRLSHLRHNRVKSCGCLHGEDHGDSGTPLHTIWRGMKSRVKKYHKDSHLYYDRDITVCDKWKRSYTEFKRWAVRNNYKEGLTIDRIDNDKGYEPSNCRFVTQEINNENRRVTKRIKYDGKEKPLTKVLREKGMKHKYGTISGRIRRGWNADDAIDTPIRVGNYN